MTVTPPKRRGDFAEEKHLQAAARKLNTHAGVAQLLNTQPGKMTLQQMQQAVVQQQKNVAKQEEQVALMAKRELGGLMSPSHAAAALESESALAAKRR